MSKPDISFLLPSRGRTVQLRRSIESLLVRADNPSGLQFLMAFDTDDKESSQYFVNEIAPILTDLDTKYTVYEFERLGYNNLNKYLNALGKYATADWWIFWNDDAIMLDHGWDTEILKQGDRFCIQAFETHKGHPYSIFPIVPRAWFDQLGFLSEHPLNDAYISQIAWMMDIMVRLPTRVDHQRYDLTGQNKDQTFADRRLSELEGNMDNPKDFNHATHRKNRQIAAAKLSNYLESLGYNMTHWKEVITGKRDPWEKMLAADVNKQMTKMSAN
jgi:hypothetical protein